MGNQESVWCPYEGKGEGGREDGGGGGEGWREGLTRL